MITWSETKRRFQKIGTAAMTLAANVVHSFARKVVGMSNVFCLCGFRIGAMEINMRLRGAVASLARHSQNHGIGVDPIHMPLFVFHARGMARNARNFYRTCEIGEAIGIARAIDPAMRRQP